MHDVEMGRQKFATRLLRPGRDANRYRVIGREGLAERKASEYQARTSRQIVSSSIVGCPFLRWVFVDAYVNNGFAEAPRQRLGSSRDCTCKNLPTETRSGLLR